MDLRKLTPKRTRCILCGGDLPPQRKTYCYGCKPKKKQR